MNEIETYYPTTLKFEYKIVQMRVGNSIGHKWVKNDGAWLDVGDGK